ncbi:thiol-disulfide oxidoreductase [Phycisphaerae bacterium RAS1]|nr:thiol-disulfide oxidoreductase [Phycisphaerae bacterium RAS1]
MRYIVLAMVVAGFLSSAAARADLKEGTIAPDIEAKEWLNTDEPVSLSDLRGMVVVLFFWVGWHDAGEAILPLVNQLDNTRGMGRSAGVYTIGITEADKKRTGPVIEKNKVFFPIALESKSVKEYEPKSLPSVVVIDPSGKIVYSGWPGTGGGNEFVKKIQDLIESNPPTKTHPREAEFAREHLENAKRELREYDYLRAFRDGRLAFERALQGDPLKVYCQNMLDLIDVLGRDMLARGERQFEEKNFSEGVTTLRQVIVQFRGSDTAKRARRLLESMAKDNAEVKKAVEAQKQEDLARVELKGALDDLRQRKFGDAVDALTKIEKDYADTSAATDARDLKTRLLKNEIAAAIVRDHLARNDCESWLSQGRNMVRSKRVREAKEFFQKVLDKYPETSFADEARKELIELP